MKQAGVEKTAAGSSCRVRGTMKCFGVVFILLVTAAFLPARTEGPLFQFGLRGQGGFPTGVFRDNIGGFNGGFGFDFIYSPDGSRLGVGASFGFLIYGSESYGLDLQIPTADLNVDFTTRNSIYLGHLLLRYRVAGTDIQPYLDVLVGLSHLTTDTQIDNATCNNPTSTNNYRDTALSCGGGGGLLVRLCGKPDSQEGRGWNIMLDLGARYMAGGEAEYLKEGGISRRGDRLVYDLKKSRTDLFTTQVGILVRF